jgi:hypothetical protein
MPCNIFKLRQHLAVLHLCYKILEKTLPQKKCKLGHGRFFKNGDFTVWPPYWSNCYQDVSSLLIPAFESLKIITTEIEAIDEIT